MAGIGRFQVMALLQAARYYVLRGDLERAKSFGLNRAIFYAWAKKRGRVRARAAPTPRTTTTQTTLSLSAERRVEKLGDEEAFISPNGWFKIGDEEQRPSDYDREIAWRISSIMPYEEAWRKAIEYVSSFDRKTLESQREFYEKVYKPVRDAFLQK